VNLSPQSKLLYICFEVLAQGTAAKTHVDGIVEGLRWCGWDVLLVARKRSRILGYSLIYSGALIKLGRVDAVYVRAHPFAWPITALARFLGKPVCHEVNGRIDDLAETYKIRLSFLSFLRWLQLKQYRSASVLIAVTDGLRDWLNAVAPNVQTEVVPNAANTQLFRPDAPDGPRFQKQYAVFFGKLVAAWHDLKALVEARRSSDWPADLDLVVAGDGPRLEELRGDPLVGDGMVLTGKLAPRDLAGVVARSCMTLCLISQQGKRNEIGVAPLKLFEGMAAGRPVVASDLPFQRDLVQSKRLGIVVPLGDPQAVASAVSWLHCNAGEAEEMGRNARLEAVAMHSWDARAQDTAAVLQRLISTR
jgi:glycosyltransferase involved in cell wall biosynthesis